MIPHPTLVFLHFLGGSSRTWAPVMAQLGENIPTITIDLPGFGEAGKAPGSTVGEMVDAVAGRIRAARPASWIAVGHSMGAKVACVLARQVADGAFELGHLAGLVLIAGSPPSPEPMDEEKRREMLGWFEGDAGTDAAQARAFIADNVTEPLSATLQDTAVEDVLRADPVRWRAWLRSGSNEDWADRVGVLQTPALVLAGADDPCLGPKAQADLMAPHFATVRQIDLPGAKHLLPLERAGAVAAVITEHLH